MGEERRIRLRWEGTCSQCGDRLAAGQWALHDPAAKSVRCLTHDDSPETTPASPDAGDDPALPKLIKLKRDGTCTACGAALAVGTEAFWVKQTRVLVCVGCTGVEVSAGLGTAGASAGRVADGAARAHAQRLLDAYPILGGHLVENAPATSLMRRWDRGADGERVVGRALDRAVAAGDVVVLHDRRVPGRGGNIDHIVIGPRRIQVVDAKHYRNQKIRAPKRGGERVLEINDAPAEELIDGVLAQRRHVEDALGSGLAGCVEAVLAFVGADLGYLGVGRSRDVWFMAPDDVVARAASKRIIGKWPYSFDADRRREIAEKLARAFPAA